MKNSNWRKQVVATGGGRRLLIRIRPGEEHWAQVAMVYWRKQYPGLEHVHRSRGAVVERGRLQQGQAVYYFKRYLARDWSESLKAAWRGTRGDRALQSGERLASLGFGAPRAECLVEERLGPIPLASALVTREVVDAENSGEWFYYERGGRSDRRQLLRSLGLEVGRFHAAGIHHGDMRKTNILFIRKPGGRLKFCWLDNERNRFYDTLPASKRVHNLVQLNMDKRGISRTDRMWFWKAYLETARVPAEQEREIVRQVIAWTQKRWRKRGWL